MVVWKPSLVQALAMVAAWFGGLFGSISVEAAVGSLDWPWYIHAGISLGFFVFAYGCVVLHNRRDWQSRHDGREVAKKIRRIPKRHTAHAEAIYQAYTNVAPELKQFQKEADHGYWAWLNEHWPDRAVRFGTHNLHLSLHDAWKERARYTGIHYYRSRFPWWKRVWAKLRDGKYGLQTLRWWISKKREEREHDRGRHGL